MKHHSATTKQLQANARATEGEIKAAKAATAAATEQRLAADVSKTHNAIQDDAVARAHRTGLARRVTGKRPETRITR